VIATPSSAYDTDVGLLETERKTFKFSGQRTLVRLPNMPLPYIKDLKNAAGVTVNDVCGRLVRDGLRVRSLVPIGLNMYAWSICMAGHLLSNSWRLPSLRG
jgi:hypothetical protein